MFFLSQNLTNKLTTLKPSTSVAYRFFATSGFAAITTRELRTFRALYNSREFLNKLQPNGNSLTNSTAFVKEVPGSETLRTFFIPSSVTGWNGSNITIQTAVANLLKQISRLEGLPVEVQQLLKFGGSTDFQAQNLPFTAEVVRLSQRQVRLLTSGSHLKEFRSLLQGGVFQLTLKVDPRKIAFYQKNATSADLLRLVAISQYNLTRRTGSLPFRAFILTPSDSRYRLSTFWRGYQLESLVKTTSALANQLHHVPTVSAISHPAKVASLVGVLSQRSAPATQLVSLISPASSAVICRTLEASVKGSVVQGSVVGTRHSQLLYRQRTLIGLINRVGR